MLLPVHRASLTPHSPPPGSLLDRLPYRCLRTVAVPLSRCPAVFMHDNFNRVAQGAGDASMVVVTKTHVWNPDSDEEEED